MIKTALQAKYQIEINLTPLDDSLADRARAAMLRRLEIE
jgi:lipid II isoglutaminyl synthase (glutamine-hydrolysing)